MSELFHYLFFLAAGDGPGWKMWPFTSAGYQGGLWPVVAKFVFIAVLFVGMAWFLRFLFGPGGWLREEGWETIQEAKDRDAKERDSKERMAKDAELPQPPQPDQDKGDRP